jgi:heme exporter protein B
VSVFLTIVRRDLARQLWSSGTILPALFFLLVATLFPFAIGPDAALLGQTGGGALWMAALLAALLPIERLVSADAEMGMFDQYAVRGISDELVAAAKLLAHWLSFGPPLMLAALPACALLHIGGPTLLRIEAGLLLGSPGLAALSLTTAALIMGLRGAGALAGLLMLPLAVPLLIFGAGALSTGGAGALKLLAATALLYVAVSPFAAGAAIRAGRE